jgi:hypothetical protein
LPGTKDVDCAHQGRLDYGKKNFLLRVHIGSYLCSKHSSHMNHVYHLIYCSLLMKPQVMHILRGGPSIGHKFRRKFEASMCDTRINLAAGSDPNKK